MGRLSLTAMLLLIGLIWKIAPEKTLSQEPLMTGAGFVVAGRAQQAPDLPFRPLPAAECASCHAEHYSEWSRSSHARSLSSEDFLRTFSRYLDSLGSEARKDPQASMACFGCHAPLLKHGAPELVERITALALAKETAKLEGFEVGCVACHGGGSAVFSGPISNPRENPFHSSKYETAYKDASVCGECHSTSPSDVPCSDVYTDWKKSRAAVRGTTCQVCHMAERKGVAAAGGPRRKIHSHIFPGARSEAMLQKSVALRLKAAFRKEHLEVTATVRNLVPHRVPDG
jgi:hypothetical protein